MSQALLRRLLQAALVCLFVLSLAVGAMAQVPPYGQPPGGGPGTPPGNVPGPQMPPPAPTTPQTPPQIQPPATQPPAGQGRLKLDDVFGRFSLIMPPGGAPFQATYNFGFPQYQTLVNMNVSANDQMFQQKRTQLSQFVQQAGGRVAKEQNFQYKGQPATMVVAYIPNRQTGQQVVVLNVFFPGPKLWLQLMAPQTHAQQAYGVMKQILQNIQFQQGG